MARQTEQTYVEVGGWGYKLQPHSIQTAHNRIFWRLRPCLYFTLSFMTFCIISSFFPLFFIIIFIFFSFPHTQNPTHTHFECKYLFSRLPFLPNFLPFLISFIKSLAALVVFLTHSFHIDIPTFPCTFPPGPMMYLFSSLAFL